MSTIISILVTYNQLLLSQINQLLVFIVKNIPLKSQKYHMTSPKYKKLTVDKLPIIKTFEKLDYKQMLREYKITNGKDKKPVNPHGKNPVETDTLCPRCGAPHNYIYDNAGGHGQFCCKVCDQHFSKNKVDFKTETFICPFCGQALSKKKDRKHFYIHKQIIERLNRTFKFSYRVTNGFGSEEGSNTHLALFVAYYNFLRSHSYAYWGPLNSIPELEKIPTMPGKWQKFIELLQRLIFEKQLA